MIVHSAIWRYAVLVLAATPLVYYALATLAALRFFNRARARVLPSYTPPVSVLKPVRGVDFGSYESFASFCRQDYPDYEILFAVTHLGAEIEAVGASSDFCGGVLMAGWMEGISFALGASIATTKNWLGKMGGFEAIAETLADDYELGHRIAKVGGEIVLSREAVWTMYPAQTLRSFWYLQVRSPRTVTFFLPLLYSSFLFYPGP